MNEIFLYEEMALNFIDTSPEIYLKKFDKLK